MRTISEDDVRYVAQLARLRVDDRHIRDMSETLSAIVSYMETLNDVETTHVSPTAHAMNMETVFREDAPLPSLPVDEALQNAPDRVGAFYRVPKIIE